MWKGSFYANLIEHSLGHSYLLANVYLFADITLFPMLIYLLYYIYLPGVRIIWMLRNLYFSKVMPFQCFYINTIIWIQLFCMLIILYLCISKVVSICIYQYLSLLYIITFSLKFTLHCILKKEDYLCACSQNLNHKVSLYSCVSYFQ